MSQSTLSKFLIFATGAAIGSVVTWKLLDVKYEQRYQEEVESTKAALSRLKDIDEIHEHQDPVIEKVLEEGCSKRPNQATGVVALKEYEDTVKKQGYVNYAVTKNQEEGGLESADTDKPYQISPDEFGNDNEYECVYLTYYEDGVLVYDAEDEEVEDVGEIVGFDFFKYFGTYEDDIVWIRNDVTRCDYEITADHRNYTDVV